jgi:hypothetical protein
MKTIPFSLTVVFFIGLALAFSAEGQERTGRGMMFFKDTTINSPVATGKVIGPDLKPEPGIPVQVVGPEGKKTFAFTDADGSWSLYNLAPGTYEVKPGPGWSTIATQQPINFTVKQPGFWEELFGTKSDKTFHATEMKLYTDSK